MQVRAMQLKDAAQIATLSEQLGYPTSTDVLRQRLGRVRSRPDNAGFVAVDRAGVLCGWVHVYGVRSLGSDGYAEIGGLVVAENMRRLGIGRALMQAVETWALENDYLQVRLYSGPQRPQAHVFYERIGYPRANIPHMFHKMLAAPFAI